MSNVTLEDYRALAAFRYELRKFVAFSEKAARSIGIEPQQHQLLLAVKGYPTDAKPTIGQIAERLCVEHHTTVGLADKLEHRGLLCRERSATDRRVVLLSLTPEGARLLRTLSLLHRTELARVGPHMVAALGSILAERQWESVPGASVPAGDADDADDADASLADRDVRATGR